MFVARNFLLVGSLMLSAASVYAQSDAEVDRQMREAERQLQESAAQMHEFERSENASASESRHVEVQMRDAERALAAAARQIAELSSQQIPGMSGIEGRVFIDRGRPVLGVNVSSDGSTGPVEGAEIVGVSPGAAAGQAGLRTGDIITAVNGESMSAENDAAAGNRLIDFMQGVEAGDQLEIDYLRSGQLLSVMVEPRSMSATLFSSGGPGFEVHRAPGTMAVPVQPHIGAFSFAGGSWGDMEMVALTERLGSYFGTEEGLLVVRAPEDEALQLQDGDVIQSIGGRVPSSVSHALRILGSYQSGEQLEIVIMRDTRKRTLNIEMPDNRQSGNTQSGNTQSDTMNFSAPVSPARAIPPSRDTIVIEERI
jgi:membrane-associated protease RseP (regulator of RpoE activity)